MLKSKNIAQLKKDYNYYLKIYPKANLLGQRQLQQHLKRLEKQIQRLEKKKYTNKKVIS